MATERDDKSLADHERQQAPQDERPASARAGVLGSVTRHDADRPAPGKPADYADQADELRQLREETRNDMEEAEREQKGTDSGAPRA